jgi:hypothetical protein
MRNSRADRISALYLKDNPFFLHSDLLDKVSIRLVHWGPLLHATFNEMILSISTVRSLSQNIVNIFSSCKSLITKEFIYPMPRRASRYT